MALPRAASAAEALRTFGAPILLFGSFVVFAEIFHEQRMRLQRRWLKRIRTELGQRFGLQRLLTIDPNGLDKGEGWKSLSLIIIFMTWFMVVVHAVDGRWKQATSALLVVAATMAAVNSSSKALVQLIWRIALVLQMLSMSNFPERDGEALSRRATMVRAAASLALFEGLDECLVQLSLIAWMNAENLGLKSAVIWLPFKMFLLFVVPIAVSGLREWLATHSNKVRPSLRLRDRSLLAVWVPMLTLIYAFSSYGVNHAKTHFDVIFGALGVLEVILFLVCTWFSRSIDELIMPCFCAAVEEEEQKQAALIAVHKSPTPSTMDERVSDFILMSSFVIFVGRGAPCLLPSHSGTSCSMSSKGSVVTLVFCSLILVALCLVYVTLRCSFGLFQSAAATVDPKRALSRRRSVAMTVHALVLGFALLHPMGSDVQVVALATSRIPLTFEKRRFSQIQSKIALCAGMSNILRRDSELSFILAFVSVTTQAFCAVISFSRENVAWIIQQEKDVQSFVHHQMKQKFSGVGSAVEHVLEACENLQDETLSVSCRQLLVNALRECRRGHDGCHIANIMRSIDKGRYLARNTPKTLRTLLGEWTNKRMAASLDIRRVTFVFFDDHGEIEDDDEILDIPFLLDWELLRLVVNEWIQMAQELVFEVRKDNGKGRKTEFILTLRVKGLRVGRTCNRVLAKALDATFSKDETTLQLALVPGLYSSRPAIFSQSMISSDVEDDRSPSTSLETLPIETKKSLTPLALNRELGLLVMDGNSAVLPPNLTFAVLDDNLLVRRNLDRVIALHLKGSKSSFTRGATSQEALFFPHELVSLDVDIAVFDENLDYDDVVPIFSSSGMAATTLKGSHLALVARQLGFKGCMILHSAHASANSCCQSSHIFDGFIEKTASRHALIAGIEAAYLNHINRMTREEEQQRPVCVRENSVQEDHPHH